MIRPKRARAPRRGQEGFTLIELMIVVVIVAVVAALAAPQVGGALSESRVNRAQLDLVRLVRRARSESVAYGRAHLLAFDSAGGGGDGSFEIYRGTTNRCTAEDWEDIEDDGCSGNVNCIDSMDMRRYATSSTVIEARVPDNDTVTLCFEPTGITRHLEGTYFTDRNAMAIDAEAEGDPTEATIGGGYVFEFTRKTNNVAVGVVRRVAVPLGGDARVLR